MFATDAAHEDRLALKELGAAMTKLPADQREALVMVVVHGMSYEALAQATGCAVGTAKSRVFRARRQLEAWLMGDTKESSRGNQRLSRDMLLAPRRSGGQIRSRLRNRPNVCETGRLAAGFYLGRYGVKHLDMKQPRSKKLTKPDQANPKPKPFDLWLERGLHEMFDTIASEPIPEDLLKLIEDDKSK